MNRRIIFPDEDRPELEKWVSGMAVQMESSAICLSIFTKDYARSIDSLLQFSVALMMDKPLYLLVPSSQNVPEHLKKIASGIETYEEGNKESMYQATRRLLENAKSKGFPA